MHESRHRFVKVELELSEVEVTALLWLLKYDATLEAHRKHTQSCFLSADVKRLQWMFVY